MACHRAFLIHFLLSSQEKLLYQAHLDNYTKEVNKLVSPQHRLTKIQQKTISEGFFGDADIDMNFRLDETELHEVSSYLLEQAFGEHDHGRPFPHAETLIVSEEESEVEFEDHDDEVYYDTTEHDEL